MNNIQYIELELKIAYPDKIISLSHPKDINSGTYFLDIDHIVVTWSPYNSDTYHMSADFDPEPMYTSQLDIECKNINPGTMLEKIKGFVDNKLITTCPYKITPEEHRARFGDGQKET